MAGVVLDTARDDRAQLLLAGAFVLAVGLIGLTLVLTSSTYTATLASHDNQVVRGSDAVAVRDTVEADLTDQFDEVFDGQPGAPSSSVETNLKTQFRETLYPLGNETGTHHARHGRLVNVTAPPSGGLFVEGSRIKQSSTDRFAEPNSLTGVLIDDWTAAEDVELRNATFKIESLTATSPATGFTLRLDSPESSGPEWTITLYQTGSSTMEIRTEGPDGGDWTCTRPRPDGTTNVFLDLDAGTAGGTHCRALAALEPDWNKYDVEFVNGNTVSGKYWMIVDAPPSSSKVMTDANRVVYGAQVRYRYHSATVSYETDLEVAPEEIT
ncbi:hypothetical protein C475_03244 [Halosimplex carlsbadense 2-9-1]|uniref:Uncharacterized protein n=1 Tax=Halosimplex carlsbadense 2-9-1 TaxID=797114 RepID=M0D4U7_9EURY|nr:hypothetical protein [Halosimplex carlsbadense]ELZ29199.1 hypothetical protein C475_03244 [Halosimplex carlsbadense 2-9-1]